MTSLNTQRTRRIHNALALLLLAFPTIFADEHNHKYKDGESVVVWSAHVGPYNNMQETYSFKQLPYCSGEAKISHRHETLGESLQGLQLENLGAVINFKQPTNATLCSTQLSSKDINLFKFAIKNHYWATVYIDDLPANFFVGDLKDAEPTLYTHQDYSFAYNGNQIIEVNLTSGNPVKLGTDKMDVTFTYTVSWTSSQVPFDKRFDKFLDQAFYNHSVHWFSIFNSFMMVLFLTFVTSMILLRAIRRDLARYENASSFTDLENDLQDEFGWKQVHGDVFRPPVNLVLFSSLIGTGVQLALLATLVILSTILGSWYRERSTMLTASIFFYALTAFSAGYVSSSYYHRYGGKEWVKNMIFTACLWPGIVALCTLAINFIAIYYSSARAIPFGTMVAVFAIWIFLVFPLTLLGCILGKNWASDPGFPCRVNPIPRPIPELKPWFAEPLAIVWLGGILPFGSIFIEMWFIFTSFWNYRMCVFCWED